MKEIVINDKISYIECSEEPLSADVGIIRDGKEIWLFDVGNDQRSIEGLSGQYHVVLSHFHQDHVGNLDKIGIKKLYVSKETQKHVNFPGEIVEKDIYVGNLHVFPLRSSHAKGSLGLEVNETYAFVGDALYCKAKNGKRCYNAQLLREEIDKLKELKANYLLASHHPGLIRKKDEVIAELEKIFARRKQWDPEIYLE
ncbi:MAG: hypothetical protein IKS85_00760 [Lachnospiraceae bacterium]|nr:hypothetical protein [Lachnospiraceae bacterium]